MRRTHSGLAAALAIAAGCWSTDAERASNDGKRPFEGVALKASVPLGSGLKDAWQSLLIEWSARTGAEVSVVERASGRPAGTMGDSIGGAGEDDAALLIFPAAEFGALVAEGRLMSIPQDEQRETALDWNDVLPGAAAIASVERRPTAVPIACPTFVLYCRGDLLEKAGLSPPRTWDDYRKLLDSLERWAPGLTAVEPWGEETRAAMFLARAASLARHPGNYSLFFDIDTGEPLIDSPAFVRALDAARADLAKMPAAVRTLSPTDCRNELLAGKAALAIGWETPPASAASSAPESAVPRATDVQVKIVRLPGARAMYDRTMSRWEDAKGGEASRAGVAGFAGTYAGVSSRSGSREAQASWNLLSVLLGADNAPTAFPGALRGSTRASHLRAPAEFAGRELTDAEAREYVAAVEETLRDPKVVAAIPVPGHAAFMASLSKGLEWALSGDEPSEAILRDVRSEWAALTETIGRDRIRDTYRRMLGLTAATDKQ